MFKTWEFNWAERNSENLKFATRLNLPKPEKFSGQSWRRTGAAIATNNGLSAPQLQAAGR
jgi:hypothetical protein